MTPTTRFGSWGNVMGTASSSPDDDVMAYVDGDTESYDVDAICVGYRDKLVALLPGTLVLVGEEFIGEVGDPAVPEDWAERFRESLEAQGDVLGDLIEQHTI